MNTTTTPKGICIGYARTSTLDQKAGLDAQKRDFVDGTEVMRADLLPGDVVEGPALIVEDETCTIVTSAFTAVAQADGALWLSARQEKETDK